jgi:glycosyltransferase involved in cell wall biosynthesis
MTSVAILYKSLPAYRLEFFERLRDVLSDEGVSLQLIHGDAVGADRSKGDARTLPWATYKPNRVTSLLGRPVVWQPALRAALRHDLVIVEQASKLLVNYPLLAVSGLPWGPRLALWGHGANLQRQTASRLSESLKRRYSRLPHWWFAYTEGSKERVARLGYPEDRITVVQNAVDTLGLQRQVDLIGVDDAQEFSNLHGLTPGHVGLFLGSLYTEKRLDFLVEAAAYAHEIDPSFSLLIGGDGPARAPLEASIADLPYVHYLGRLDGEQRAMALRASDVMLMPGLVGLGILDAFAAGLPLITTDLDFHSPEIEYLENGRNGVLLPGDATAQAFGDSVAAVLADQVQKDSLKEQSRSDAQRYSTESMVERFKVGVMRALATA